MKDLIKLINSLNYLDEERVAVLIGLSLALVVVMVAGPATSIFVALVTGLLMGIGKNL